MFTNGRDDMGLANLPNVRGDEQDLRGKRTALTPLERGVVNFTINFEFLAGQARRFCARWPRAQAVKSTV